MTVPRGLVADVFQRALDALLPGARPARCAVLAGPGLAAPDMDADIIFVPVHSQTGETWSPPGPVSRVAPAGPTASPYPVPLPFGVWMWMAFPEPGLRPRLGNHARRRTARLPARTAPRPAG